MAKAKAIAQLQFQLITSLNTLQYIYFLICRKNQCRWRDGIGSGTLSKKDREWDGQDSRDRAESWGALIAKGCPKNAKGISFSNKPLDGQQIF